MATIKDVAAYAKVSLATVSKYINGGNVRPELAARIAEAVSALQYVPNPLAQQLKASNLGRKPRSRTIGLVSPTLNLAFFGETATTIENELRREGYGLIVSSYHHKPECAVQDIRMMIDRGVDGLIVIPEKLTCDMLSEIAEIQDRRVPMVLYNRVIQNCENDCVITNNESACQQAVEMLIQQGHERIAIIHSRINSSDSERLNGYRKALTAHGIPIRPEYMRLCAFDLVGGYYSCLDLLELRKPPTAILCVCYELTLGVVAALNEKNFRIPQDISLIGYDNLYLNHVIKPPLAVVVQPIEEYVQSALQLLFQRMNGDYSDYPSRVCVNSWLIPGESIAPPAK